VTTTPVKTDSQCGHGLSIYLSMIPGPSFSGLFVFRDFARTYEDRTIEVSTLRASTIILLCGTATVGPRTVSQEFERSNSRTCPTEVIKPTALTVGVGGLVQRTYRTQDLARISVDQIDMTEIPSRVAQTHALQVPVR
jgi:hypothetical protein